MNLIKFKHENYRGEVRRELRQGPGAEGAAAQRESQAAAAVAAEARQLTPETSERAEAALGSRAQRTRAHQAFAPGVSHLEWLVFERRAHPAADKDWRHGEQLHADGEVVREDAWRRRGTLLAAEEEFV